MTQLHAIDVCDLCISGAGGECHTPGCAFWMADAPSSDVLVSLRRAAVRTDEMLEPITLCGGTGSTVDSAGRPGYRDEDGLVRCPVCFGRLLPHLAPYTRIPPHLPVSHNERAATGHNPQHFDGYPATD